MSRADADTVDSTIVAIATPPGRGGIGIVRLSGPEALRIAQELFSRLATLQPRTAVYSILHGSDGSRIDDALVTYFPGPASYTGEDVVEIATHGSPVVQDWLLRACVEQGAVPARPGEFTERAFLTGKLDLPGAEAVQDLIEAQTMAQAQLAAEQIAGSLAAAILPVKQPLLQLIATLEAGIDFAEDDLQTLPESAIFTSICAIKEPLIVLLNTFQHGRLLRQGIRLAIVGEPNVGKSSLFNRLLQQERAIVTATPGTTRDVIAERMSLDGYPVELLDTAGLRETVDEVERIGVQRSREVIAEADAVLLVLDSSLPPAEAVSQQQTNLPAASDPGTTLARSAFALLQGRPVLLVWNKTDLMPAPTHAANQPVRSDEEADGPGLMPSHLRSAGWPVVYTSATTGFGIPELKQALLALVQGGQSQAPGTATLTNLRQKDAVQRAGEALARAGKATTNRIPDEMILLDLYEALRALDELTGETTPDDVLHLIFSTFCIGK